MQNQNNDINVNPNSSSNPPPINSDFESQNSKSEELISQKDGVDSVSHKLLSGLSDLTPEQLKNVEEAVKKEREGKSRQTLINAYDNLVEAAKASDLTIEKALGICNPSLANLLKGSKKPTVIKYRNPNNKVDCWTGRGRKPSWFTDNLAAGMSEADMLV